MQTSEAGSSNIVQESASQVPSDVPSAPLHPLPSTQYYSVEYPGYVQPNSVPLAVERLGGQSDIDAAFKRTGGKSNSLIELNLRPGDPFAHPIAGEVIATNNILMKVVKRKRQKEDGQMEPIGEYTVEAMGVIPKTTRFRSECRGSLYDADLYPNCTVYQAWQIININSTRKIPYSSYDMLCRVWMVGLLQWYISV